MARDLSMNVRMEIEEHETPCVEEFFERLVSKTNVESTLEPFDLDRQVVESVLGIVLEADLRGDGSFNLWVKHPCYQAHPHHA